MLNVLGNAAKGSFKQNIQAKVEAQSITNRLIQSGYNNALIPGVDEIAKQLKQSNATAFLDAFGAQACTGANRIHPRLPVCNSNGFWLPHRECPGNYSADGLKSENDARIKIEHQIDTILRNPKPLPVGITFCDNLLRQGVSYESHILLRDGGNGDCSLHTALIIGERLNKTKNRREFLLRNSWGKGCGLSSDWECNPANGDLWISADVLAKNILLTHTLAP